MRNKISKPNYKIILMGATALSFVFSMSTHISAIAQTKNPAEKSLKQEKQEKDVVISIGTRRKARSAANTPAPIDVIGGSELVRQGSGNISNLLRTVIPSYNVNRQPISDTATIVRPANLRGLAPDQTLVLVNGKRRHRAAVISFLGNGVSDGAQGADLSVIPALALKQVDILRDAASAQYGSDAIAGVMNFVLKDSPDGFTVEGKYGSTYEGDGQSYQIAANWGVPLTENGYANFTVELQNVDPTSRSVQREDALELIAAGNTDIANPVQVWGAPKIRNDFKAFANLGLNLGNGAKAYAFGNYAQKDVKGGFFYRNPNTRSGVFSNDGGKTRLVADLKPNDGQSCPVITIGASDEPALLDQVSKDPNCFVFNEKFPGGFTPKFGAKVNDLAGVAGIRGEYAIGNGLTYDISLGAGRNEARFLILNTINATLGKDSPTNFKPGAYIQLEKNFNADFSYPVPIEAFASDLNVAFGFEWRDEEFQVIAGDAASSAKGPLLNQGFSIGSNGFGGFSPEIAGRFNRSNVAIYTDLEADVTDNIVLSGALRWENFDGFGNTVNYKLAGLWKPIEALTFRSTYSTGFRAPTPGQSNVSNVSTVFMNQTLTNRGTIPPTNPVAAAFGGKPLDPEKSKNLTIGSAFSLAGFNFTLDYYNIALKDRIAQTSTIDLTKAQIKDLVAQGVEGANNLESFRYFTNAIDTKTQGIDFVAFKAFDLLGGSSTLSTHINYNKTEVTNKAEALASGEITEKRIILLQGALPEWRGNVAFTHARGRYSGLIRINYYGGFTEFHLDDTSLKINPSAKTTVDLELDMDLGYGFGIAIGADNILNTYPDKNKYAEVGGAKYPNYSPFGFNGGFYYLKLRWVK